MNLRSLVYDIWSVARGASISDDDDLSERLLSEWIIQTRNELIRNAYNKGQSLNPDLEQTLTCVQLGQIPATECPCNIDFECQILKTVKKIPSTIEVYQKNLITRISSDAMLNVPFSIIPFERSPYIQSSKYGKDLVKAFIHSNYIYLVSSTYFDTINIKGVFEDPRELNDFLNCQGEQCFTDESTFPISSYMLNILKQRIVDVDLKVFLNVKTDQKNDSEDNTNKK